MQKTVYILMGMHALLKTNTKEEVYRINLGLLHKVIFVFPYHGIKISLRNTPYVELSCSCKISKKFIQQRIFRIQCKWPNDLIYNGSKLGGILIDIIYKKDSTIFLVVGVGINLEVSEADKSKSKHFQI